MDEDELLKGEAVEKILSPHPLSFMRFQSLSIFLVVWGVLVLWVVNASDWQTFFVDNFLFSLSFWAIGLLLAGIVASLVTIQWSIFFLYLGIFGSATGIILWLGIQDAAGIFIPFYSVAMSIIGFLMVEWYRRSHKYIISN